jgi:hypothetical protein
MCLIVVFNGQDIEHWHILIKNIEVGIKIFKIPFNLYGLNYNMGVFLM